MTGEVQAQIHKFLYHLSNENYAKADKTIHKILEKKIMDKYDAVYANLEKRNQKTNKSDK